MANKDSASFLEHVRDLRWNDITGFLKLGIAFFPALFWKMAHPNTWVISELPDNARDNGYWLFWYVRTYHPDIDVYYPIHRQSSDYKKVSPLGNVIEFGSLKHYMLFLTAKKYMTTTKQHGFPHERIGILFVLNELSSFRYIFLNHGVARGYSSIVDGRDTNYDMIIAISEAEKNAIVKYNYQSPDIVKPIGFCRHDNLDDSLLEDDLILFMPTWRNWLDYRHITDEHAVQCIKDGFFTSQYYLRIQELLTSNRLVRFLERNNLRMIVYLHGYAQTYSSCFSTASHRIKIAKKSEYFVQDLLKQASYLITDYSSVIFDFAYMKKPCCYYQFDAQEFAQKQYAESEFFTYEHDGFGPVFSTLNQVLDDVETSHGNGFTMSEKYAQRVADYFPSFGKDHCRRTYELIKALPDK